MSLDNLIAGFLEWFKTSVPSFLSSFLTGAGNFALRIPSFAVATLVFAMASYFIASDYPKIREAAVRHIAPSVRQVLTRMRDVALSAFGGYLKAELILSTGVFLILLAGFLITGQSYAFILALLLAILDFIPIVGAGTVLVPWAIVSIILGDYSASIGLWVIFGIITLFRRVGEPKVLGDQTGLSPILSLFGIYIGMRVGGLFGMAFGPVLFLVVLNICKTGIFDGLVSDLKRAVLDIASVLSGGKRAK